MLRADATVHERAYRLPPARAASGPVPSEVADEARHASVELEAARAPQGVSDRIGTGDQGAVAPRVQVRLRGFDEVPANACRRWSGSTARR
jgi:hypothetical protein